jgi:LuxR family transcriptional activator of conjugal transfer of Ti plasmids
MIATLSNRRLDTPATREPARLPLPRTGGAVADQLQEALRDLALRFGLKGAHYVHLGHAVRAIGAEGPARPVRFLTTSVSDRRLYLEEGGLTWDPPLPQIAQACRPFAWTTAAIEQAGEDGRWLASRLKGRGVHGGVAAPVQDYAAGPAYLSFYSAFSGEAEALLAAHGPELAWAAAGFHEEAKRRLAPIVDGTARLALTTREIDCLRLAALGQTVQETAEALQVTPRTVEFHLKNAADKFGASNKLRAVALAISRGLISV